MSTTAKTPLPPLTPTEQLVLEMVWDGLADWEIGHYLGISKRTASFHLANIYAKWKTRRVGAIRLALTHGLLSLEGTAK